MNKIDIWIIVIMAFAAGLAAMYYGFVKVNIVLVAMGNVLNTVTGMWFGYRLGLNQKIKKTRPRISFPDKQ